jgi:hypothetical protein
MKMPLQGKNINGDDINYRLSVLDMTRIAAKLAVDCLDDNDIVSIVQFADVAMVSVDPTPINRDNTVVMNDIYSKIDIMPTDEASGLCGSPLWGGIKAGLNCLREFQQDDKGTTIYNVCMVLTDGGCSRKPTIGWSKIQLHYQNESDFSDYTLNTLGFGHTMHSKRLVHLARDGNGVFANVPDFKLLGTVFTNMLAPAKVTTHKRLRLCGCQSLLQGVVGDYLTKNKVERDGYKSWCIELGTLAAGQVRFFVLDLTRPLADFHNEAGRRILLYLEATSCQQQSPYPKEDEFEEDEVEEYKFDGPFSPAADDVLLPVLRILASVELMSLHEMLAVAIKAVRLARLKIKTNPAGEHGLVEALLGMETASAQAGVRLADFCNRHPALTALIGMPLADEYEEKPTGIQALYADLMHQVKIALGPDHFERWGHSYLLALAMAYQQHFTLNGTDPGVQKLGGPCFEQKAMLLSSVYDGLYIPTQPERNDRLRDPSCIGAHPLEEGLTLNDEHGVFLSSDPDPVVSAWLGEAPQARGAALASNPDPCCSVQLAFWSTSTGIT